MQDTYDDTETENMLKQYDTARAALKKLEHNLNRAAMSYGRRRGVWGYTKDHLRIALSQGRKQA